MEMDKNSVNSNENPKNQEIANTNEKQLKLVRLIFIHSTRSRALTRSEG